jgi:hypothetical protein
MNWTLYADRAEYFADVVKHQEIMSGWFDSWAWCTIDHIWTNWHTSSVDDMRLRPFIHFSSDLAACIEIFLCHTSLYSVGAMVLDACLVTQRSFQKLMVLSSPKCTSVHARNSVASVGDDESGRVCHGMLVSVQRSQG